MHALVSQAKRFVSRCRVVLMCAVICLGSAGATAQETGRHSFAQIGVEVLSVTATPIGSSSGPAEVEVRWANIAEVWTRLENGIDNQIARGINGGDGVPHPWHVALVEGTSSAVASASDSLFTNAQALSDIRGAHPTWGAAKAQWFSSLDLLLSPQSRLTIELHVTGDASGWGYRGYGYYDYFFQLADIYQGYVDTVQAYQQVTPFDAYITLSYPNHSMEPRRVIWGSHGFTHASLAPVPEPAGMAMLSTGLLLIVPMHAWRRRDGHVSGRATSSRGSDSLSGARPCC